MGSDGGGSAPPKYSAVFLRIARRGQFTLSWSQPLAHPPQRRIGIVGEEIRFPGPGAGAPLVDVTAVELLVPVVAAARFLRSDQVRSSFCNMYLPLVWCCFMTMNSQ